MGRPRSARPHAEVCIEDWQERYVSGHWSLDDLEAHLDAMLPLFTPEDWLPRTVRPARMNTPKQAAAAWSEATARKASNYALGVSHSPST